MVDAGVQTIESRPVLSTTLPDHTHPQGTSMSDHSYFKLSADTSKPLDTGFISSPCKDPDADSTPPSPPSSPCKPDSDSDYVPTSDESQQSNESNSSDNSHLTTEPKMIAFESSMKSLFARTICTECGDPISADETIISYNGTAMKAKFTCMKGHHTSWESQPVVNNKPAGNIMVATSIILSGETYTRIAHFADILSLKFIGATQFYELQKIISIPAIDRYYNIQRDVILHYLNGHELTLSGDGRCDSPGFSAKYCTYTFMDSTTGVIPDFNVVQVSETTSSVKMELLGFQRSLESITTADLSVKTIVTDRHTQIRKVMGTDHKDKNHQFDVWHISKSIKKKLTAIKPPKVQTVIKPWIPAICNHVWYCSRQANGDPDKLEEIWRSLLYHITNRHTFPGQKVTSCGHPPLTADEVRKKKWLDLGSPAYLALEKVVTDTRLIKDIRQVDLFCHTGALETYHSMMLKYCPKRQEFDYPAMVARSQLAVIDNNANIGRGQKTDANGTPCFATRCPKTTGRWTARKVYEKKKYDFKSDILEFALTAHGEATVGTTSHQMKSLTLPTNICKEPAPCKEDLVDEHRSRFS